MRPFAIVEGVLVACLAVALIAKPPTNRLPAATVTESKVQTSFGDARPMGDGFVRSWVRTVDGKPAAIGVAIDEAAMKHLPTTGDRGNSCCANEIVLRLPEGVSVAPFDHIAVNWNPQGHPPEGVYDKPHFDFHFYMQDAEAREKITAEGAELAKAPPADTIPAGFIATPGVMKMGVHWVDPTGPEFKGTPFTQTFLYGAFDGKVTFIEPMITKAFIESKAESVQSIKQPKVFPAGSFPTAYSMKYDEAGKRYLVALEGLTSH
jgi:hypothetical protein